MLKIFKTKNKVGTVGCRLHFSNNTVQHDGVSILMKSAIKSIIVDHLMRETYYKYGTDVVEVGGNTAALMMIQRKTFDQVGGFNEIFRHCYEDAMLSLYLLKNGYNNYCNCNYVAYHHESQTRDLDTSKEEMVYDFNNHVYPFIQENFDKLKKHIIVTN
jgi:GT2 family glycosyltransferase